MSRELDGWDGNSYDYDLGFDPDESSLAIPRHQRRRGITSRRGPKNAPKAKARKPYKVRRLLIADDRLKVAKGINQAVEGRALGRPVLIEDPRLVGVSIFDQLQGQEILKRYFGRPDDRFEAITSFNKAITQHAERTQQKNPSVSAQVGELAVFQSDDPTRPEARFVGFKLVGEGARTLTAENAGFVAALGSSAICSPPMDVDEVASGYLPHVKLFLSPTEAEAESLLSFLEEARAVPAIRRQLPNPPAGESPSVTFKQVQLNLNPIPI